jgi:hypothetical protein
MLGGVGRERARRFALTLVPLGVAMWTAHLVFHLLSGWDSLLMVVHRWLPDGGSMRAACTGADLLGLEILLLDAGLLVTLYAMWRTVRTSNAAAMIPWAAAAVGLYGSGIWIFLQPMQMRGMMVH